MYGKQEKQEFMMYKTPMCGGQQIQFTDLEISSAEYLIVYRINIRRTESRLEKVRRNFKKIDKSTRSHESIASSFSD